MLVNQRHPLRDKTALARALHDKAISLLLHEKGYLNSELDQSLERSRVILDSPFVRDAHIVTGGKKTHDVIVV